MPTLDLSTADDRPQFAPLPEGIYNASIKEVTLRQVKPGGKLPEDTAQIAVQFAIDEDDIPNEGMHAYVDEDGNEKEIPYTKNVFTNYHIVKDKTYQHKQTMDNILYGFLKSVGFSVEELKSGNFDLDLDDLPGRRCQVSLKLNEYQSNGETRINNQVNYVKSAGEGVGLV